ncbi:Aste57867_10548 [Aphanomyces stellatus]|uniref:Aste57867_10548 protein n=1 Tax=Aphanomyces stellatus TaxID=120398 RepID=A0A485KQP0_9STRA|nr:hypothetical protein As57867_010508 [Aphanomyces stellatus]VFT87421.1 Aste57867_10548 [Aphanomyces stellatus]
MKTTRLLGCVMAATMLVDAINPIEIKGTHLFDAATGTPFQVKGVDYYPRPNSGINDVNSIDFFSDDMELIWAPHVQEFVALGVNTIRLYAVDASKSHDKFMCALSAAGIYVIVELGASCENCSIGSAAYPACYPPELKTRGQQIIAAFSKFNNVLGFSAGNEVNHVVTDMKTNAPCQKKFIRDMRAFINSCATNMRYIPVGVVLADSDRDLNALYYNCRTDPNDTLENAEWYGLNAYLQCDPGTSLAPTTIGAGYRNLLNDFTSYQLAVPALLTEFGCLNVGFPTAKGYQAQRTWHDAGWLLSPAFADIFAGGLAFEFSTENANSKDDAPFPFASFGMQNYGLGYFDPVTCEGTAASPCTYKRMPNFDLLAAEYNASKASLPTKAAYTPLISTVPACPASVATLQSVMWPSDSTTSMLCPDLTQTPLCPGDVILSGTGKTIATGKTTPSPVGGNNAKPNTSAPSHASIVAVVAAAMATMILGR